MDTRIRSKGVYFVGDLKQCIFIVIHKKLNIHRIFGSYFTHAANGLLQNMRFYAKWWIWEPMLGTVLSV